MILYPLFLFIGVSFVILPAGIRLFSHGEFFNSNQLMFARVGGILVVLFGLYQLGFFGTSQVLGKERRLPFKLDALAMSPFTALLMGFTFSFAWTPCVGPAPGQRAADGVVRALRPRQASGWWPCTRSASCCRFWRWACSRARCCAFSDARQRGEVYGEGGRRAAHRHGRDDRDRVDERRDQLSVVVRRRARCAGAAADQGADEAKGDGANSGSSDASDAGKDAGSGDGAASKADVQAAPLADLKLVDQNGKEHSLDEYRGKTVFLNFWATWCPPCKREMPEIQALYERYGENEGDLIVLGVANPKTAEYPNNSDETQDVVEKFLKGQRLHLPRGDGPYRRHVLPVHDQRLPHHLHDRQGWKCSRRVGFHMGSSRSNWPEAWRNLYPSRDCSTRGIYFDQRYHLYPERGWNR